MTGLDGKVALITGGARGIGRAVAATLVEQGVRVAIADRKIELARETARQLGDAAEAFEYDQAHAESVEKMVADVAARCGRVDLLFANAGTGKFAPLVDMSTEDWDVVIKVNLSGTYYVCREVAKAMIAQGMGGRMVLTASSGARVIANQLGAYCVAKAGVVLLAKQLASELGNYRINVNAICPGVIETDMTGPMLGREEWRRMLRRQTPAGRWGSTKEVAALVAFLLSDAAGYINGEDIMIDGGSTLQAAPRWYSLDYSEEQNCDWDATFSKYPYA